MGKLSPERRLSLYRSSVVVTGGHYSLTSVIGEVLACSSSFHAVIEPINKTAPLWFRTLEPRHDYEYFDDTRYSELREGLIRLMNGEGFASEAVRRLGRVRSLRDAAQIVRLVRREVPMRLEPRPAIFKEPFLTFTARTMQQNDGIRVVLGMRHPCAWIESVLRRDQGFDFEQLMQPALLEALPELADEIAHNARANEPALDCAILAWRVIQTFHARYLLGHERTLVIRQDALVSDPRATAERLFRFAGVERPEGLEAFLRTTFTGREIDRSHGPGSYTRRDGPAVLEKWRQRLAPEEQALIRRETEELAATFGYGEKDW